MAALLPIVTPLTVWSTSVLIVLGLVIGFLNISAVETQTFLVAALALVIVSGFGSTSGLITQVAQTQLSLRTETPGGCPASRRPVF